MINMFMGYSDFIYSKNSTFISKSKPDLCDMNVGSEIIIVLMHSYMKHIHI